MWSLFFALGLERLGGGIFAVHSISGHYCRTWEKVFVSRWEVYFEEWMIIGSNLRF
ncbi:hypothetical protein [Paenibacillus sp. SC116]|uniref:hypothetical protein n=1 Tax=Paenibacillus sp. SC116 TaxID=2968986 RepID=UPI00215A5A4F|nr:hypothetical protein [Paenibacillus sp. SC116]